jgi:hypothetical protein
MAIVSSIISTRKLIPFLIQRGLLATCVCLW